MAPHWILAIDAGTTGITVTAYDRHFQPTLSRSADFAQHYPQAGWVEHDAAEIRDLTLRLVREVASLVRGEIRAVGITNQRETIVPFDMESGEPLHRAIVWQCRRTSEACGKLRSQGHEPMITARTGLVLDPYFSASKIAWLLEQSPSCQVAQARGTLRMATIDAWLVHALTGGRTLATDPSNASRTLLYDIDQRTWAPELLTVFGIPAFVLPEVRPSAGDFGTTDLAQVGFEAPISGVLGDQQAALFGHGGFSVGDAKNTYGTGCFLLVNAGPTRPATCPGVLTTLGAAPDGTPVYVQEGAVFVAGAAVQWLRDGLRIIRSADETEALAASLPDNGGRLPRARVHRPRGSLLGPRRPRTDLWPDPRVHLGPPGARHVGIDRLSSVRSRPAHEPEWVAPYRQPASRRRSRGQQLAHAIPSRPSPSSGGARR
jgi:glycerol kinase